MINFTQAFDSAWERMHVILFRSFDFGKWCAIGLSAFLAGFLQGGNGFNFNVNGNPFQSANNLGNGQKFSLPQLHSDFHNAIAGLQLGIIVLVVLMVMAIIFAIILVVYWLGARGQFLLLDNIVRNRGAISWPWQYYARQANSLFFFYLLFLVISVLILLPIIAVGIVMAIPLFRHHRWPEGGEIAGFVLLALVYLAVALVMSVAMFIFREFGIPIMFRQGLLARPAFWASLQLIGRHPGSITIFILLRMAIFIGVAVLSTILCCVTCCLELLPYVGTVMLLPVLIYVRCFTLDCLAQFGPEYNVWTVDVPPVSPPPRL
jgi:hypothetical protein